MSDANAKFLTGSPLRHITVMSLTASMGIMAVFAVNFVDMIFIRGCSAGPIGTDRAAFHGQGRRAKLARMRRGS